MSENSNRNDRTNSLLQDGIHKKIKFEETKTCKGIHLEQIYVTEDRISSHNVTINI